METLCSKGSDTSFSLRLALLNLGRLPVGCDTWLQVESTLSPFPFSLTGRFSGWHLF